jgi:UDP-N-acetylglucosamine 2-epimerase (non-hydrolysing)
MLDSLRLAKKTSLKLTIAEASGEFAIASLHRFETISQKKKLEQVVNELIKISKQIKILFILHPPTRVALKKANLYDLLERESACQLLPRLGFFEFNHLLRKAKFIITDGGSNQEECSYLGTPCLLFRSETERMEGLNANVVLSNFNSAIIDDFVTNYSKYRREPVSENISPSHFIVDQLKEFI